MTAGPAWGLSFGYDGFGNKVPQTVVKGSARRLVPAAVTGGGTDTYGTGRFLTPEPYGGLSSAGGLESSGKTYNAETKQKTAFH